MNRPGEPAARVPVLAVVLPFSESRELLRSCGGPADRADSLWTPTAAVLGAVDHRLAEQLAAHSRGAPLRRYSRQYLGIHRDGRRLVRINGVHQTYLDGAVGLDSAAGVPRPASVARIERWFRSTAIRVCDGGSAFFTGEYDVEADRISSFAFNGVG